MCAGWPYLMEARIESLSDELFKYTLSTSNQQRQVIATPHDQRSLGLFTNSSEEIETHYSKRYGVLIGPVEVLVHAFSISGMKMLQDGSIIKDFSQSLNTYALQTIVIDPIYEDERFKVCLSILFLKCSLFIRFILVLLCNKNFH